GRDALEQKTIVGISWLDRGAMLSAFDRQGCRIQPQPGLLLEDTMTREAALRKERFDLFQIVDRLSRRGAVAVGATGDHYRAQEEKRRSWHAPRAVAERSEGGDDLFHRFLPKSNCRPSSYQGPASVDVTSM